MNINYAIFRSEPIMTTNDLAQIGSHNQREKKAYKSNPDIRIEDSYKNIQLVPLNYKYVKRFHELTKEYEKQHNEKMKTTKNTIFDKEYVKVKRETFDSMNKVIKETKKVVEFQPKIEQLFNEVNKFTKSHQTLEKGNSNLKREVKSLVIRNQNLTAENNKLKNYIDVILEAIKKFFRKILQFGNKYAKVKPLLK